MGLSSRSPSSAGKIHTSDRGGGGGGRVLRVLAPPGLERHLGKEETVSKLNLLRAGPETLQEGRAVA